MKKIAAITSIGFMAAINTNNASAQEVFFTGFEGGIDNTWTQIEPVANSGVAFQGSGSAQVNSGGSLNRDVDVEQNTEYTITAYVRGGGRLRVRWAGQNQSTRVTNPSNNFIERSVTINSGSATSIEISLEFESEEGRFDNISVVANGSSSSSSSSNTSSGSGNVFTLEKQNQNFSIDGGVGAEVGRQVFLIQTNLNNVNQQWIEIDRGNGFYTYQKQNTNVCLDGGNGGARLQAVINFTCNANNQNQHWRRVNTAGGSFRLEKRNAPGFSIDGNNGASNTQVIYLWNSNSNNVNQQWNFLSNSATASTPSPTSAPTPTPAPTPAPAPAPTSGSGDFGLSPNLQPWENFDLSVWGLDSPALRDLDDEDRGTRIEDYEFVALRDGPSNPDFEEANENFFDSEDGENSDPYFFTAADGGMVFKSPVDGGRTSAGSRFPRSELREYTRGGEDRRDDGTLVNVTGATENNWVLGYQPQNLELRNNAENVGGRNGVLTATLRVNKVTETGRDDDIGVVIIGQIHASSDEPLRLYYRKLPDNDLGSIYFLHEINDGSDLDEFIIVGSRDDDASNPVGGIALDELFSYEIIAEGSEIEVVVRRGDSNGPIIDRITIDMDDLNSGYDERDEWMYFKAGAYTQNNVAVEDGEAGAATTGFGPNGNEADYDQVTFYRLNVSHDDNNCSSCD